MARMADGQEHASIFFPYRKDGEVVNWKARALNEKLFTQKKGGEQMLFNLESALGGGDVYITEGEMDALSLIEAGIPRAVYALAPLRASRHSHLD